MPEQLSWHFPPRNRGVEYVQDPSSQYFGDAPVAKLVREAIQNSLDARDPGLPGPVEVEFRAMTLSKEDFGGAQLESHIQACYAQAKTEKDSRIQAIYRRALDRLKKKQVECLTIADSGTYGLKSGRWESLVLREGSVNKQDGAAGGSFGIGKNAVFNLSDLRAVIYSTRYVDRTGFVEKMQGKATLMSHTVDRDPLQHVGFLASPTVDPVMSRDIPQPLRLDRTGTRVTILGFNPRSDDWVGEVIRATLDNFFFALHKRNLVVRVISQQEETTEINHETIDGHFQRLANSDSYFYYRAIRDVEPAETDDIPKIGALSMCLLMDDGAPRRICLVNSKGMKITDSTDQRTNAMAPRSRNLWPDYTAVVVPGKNGDEWLRQTENVSHDALSAERFVEPEKQREATQAFQEARRAIRDAIDEQVELAREADTSNLRELAQIFPDDLSPDAPGNIGLYTRVIERSVRRSRATANEPADDQPGDGDQPEPNRERDGDGKTHEGGATRNTGGGERQTRVTRPPLEGLRFAPLTRNSARLAFSMPSSAIESVSVVLRPVGSEGVDDSSISIREVKVMHPHEVTAKLSKGRIELQGSPGTRVILEVIAAQPIDTLAVRVE